MLGGLFIALVWVVWAFFSVLSLVLGILLLVVSGFVFLIGLRAFPPGTYRPGYLHPTTIADLMTSWLISGATLAGGLFLILA